MINSRPFVLRDGSAPKTTLTLSDRAENLEGIELRLKEDILRESRRYGGLILTHDELDNGDLIPTWTSVDSGSVQTLREAFEGLIESGWGVVYYRTPISSDRPIEDNYLDAYVSILKDVDPLHTSLVFNDGLGAVRATYAMIAALIVRRKQYILKDLDEPFSRTGSGISTPIPGLQGNQFFRQAQVSQVQSAALLKLTRLTTKVLESVTDLRTASSATDLLVTRPALLESLRNAYMGNYQVILSLLSLIDHGRERKDMVDALIENCDQVVDLREIIVEFRMQYSVSSGDEKSRLMFLDRAAQALERYFFLIAFASYVEEEDAGTTGKKFSEWLLARPEIWNHIRTLRRRGGSRLFLFSPINDLTSMSRMVQPNQSGSENKGKEQWLSGERDPEDRVLGDEWSQYTIANRSGIILRAGTLLKSDQWQTDSASTSDEIKGAVGFRHIESTSLFALGSSHADAILPIIDEAQSYMSGIKKILWINLREEPIVLISGAPYCLRKETMSLRNVKDYSGVSPSRLETFDERLSSDVLNELKTFEGKVLLHTESEDGYVRPTWEDAGREDVQTLKQVMDQVKHKVTNLDLQYLRLPITSRSVIEFDDVQALLTLCLRNELDKDTAIILHDQLGRGRSTITSVMVLLITRWAKRARDHQGSGFPRTPRLAAKPNPRSSWQIVNSLLRCFRMNGLGVKREVDNIVDQCGEFYNIREVIEDAYKQADEADNERERKLKTKECKTLLRIYLQLLQLQAFLAEVGPDDATGDKTFQSWWDSQPVFATFDSEILHGSLEVLMPIPTLDNLDGPATLDEAEKIVLSRHGSILSSGTIIKSDLFLGLQKQSLPERVDGASNFREVPLLLPSHGHASSDRALYGTGMPTADGLRKALQRMNAQPGGSRHVVWTSMREEPVLYISRTPYVLRLQDKPITNIEATGVENTVVEGQERQFKADVLQELKESGRILLHDEVETTPGAFEVVPLYESVKEEDIMTPRELYEQVRAEGYNVTYQRYAVTDERSPIPAVFATLIESTTKHLEEPDTDLVFNCQMGRGRTTTGMIASSIIATIAASDVPAEVAEEEENHDVWATPGASVADLSEETVYKRGEYKMILQLMSVLTHGREAKIIADRVIDVMSGVQNLREAVYDYKVKVDSIQEPAKRLGILRTGVNYLYRYGMLIVLAEYILEAKAGEKSTFTEWLAEKREVLRILGRQTLD